MDGIPYHYAGNAYVLQRDYQAQPIVITCPGCRQAGIYSCTSASCHITPVLRSLHWLKITEGIECKLLSLTYKVLTTNQPPYLHHLISPLPSNRHHRSCGDCLEGKGENYQVCSVQYCVQQLCTVRCTHI